MKFEMKIINNQTHFIAICDNVEEKQGFRAQGPYTPIKLINNTLIIDYVSKNKLHPDIIGAICITAFYPFIKYTATMPFSVSKKFKTGLQMDILPQHDKIDGVYKAIKPITITNIDENLKPYNNGKKTIIAYGGGIDSTAIALLFPEFPLIHTLSCNKPHITNVMKKFIKENLKNESYIKFSNCRELCNPSGFTTFTNIFLLPLMLTADMNIRNICCGEILGSSCLSNGKKFFPQFNPLRRNRWIRFYNYIGINIFSPIAGCSELITSKIIYKYNLSNKVLYCETNNGYPCLKCTKCLRKLLLLTLHGFDGNFNHFNKEYISKFLIKRPLYFGHIFIETIKNNKQCPKYLIELISDISHIDTKLFNKIYPKSFIYFPDDIKEHLINKLTKYAEIMSEEEEKYLEKWNMMLE
jgi:hypothetical protein